MTYIITSTDRGFFSKTGDSAQDILQRSGDALKTSSAPISGEVSRMEHYLRTGNASSSDITRRAADSGAMTGGLGASQTMYTSPQFYSPIHTPTNWQIPTKRRETYMWSRFFSENDPTIKGALRFYSQFPFHGYEHVIDDPIRKEHFDNLKKRLKLDHILPLVAYEYFSMGDAFPFISIFCPSCGGFGLTKNGEPCNHKDGQISSVTVMNPDWIDVQINPLLPTEPVISLMPDDTLKQIVWSKKPPEVYNKIPLHLRQLIMQQRPIPLSNLSITHMKHDEVPYMAYGRPIMGCLFPTLAYQDRLRQAQWIVAERHIIPIRVCKVGNDERPASASDIADTQRQLATTANDPNLTLVTHHAFCYDQETETLTENGWKKYWDVKDDEKIMVFDKENQEMRYEHFQKRFEYNYSGKMIHFSNQGIDVCVTPEHKILYQEARGKEKNIWKINDAETLTKERYRFRANANWNGNDVKYVKMKVKNFIKRKISKKCKNNFPKVKITTFMKFLGYFLSEGYASWCEKGGQRVYQISITQSTKSPYIDDIRNSVKEFAKEINKNYTEYISKERDVVHFYISSKVLSRYFIDNFGSHARNKKIPQWIKNLKKDYIEILLNSFNNGDARKDKSYKCGTYYQVSVFSEQLVEDIYEIAFKCGYSPKLSRHKGDERTPNGRLCANFGDGDTGRFPIIKKKQISTIDYNGTVWCFQTSTGFFVTRRNGKIGIHKNSYEWIGACYTENIKVMTKRGFLKYWEVEKSDEIATYNSDTKEIEYHPYLEKFVYDYDSDKDGQIIKFKSKHYDVEVTANHKMYAKTWNAKEEKYDDFKLINAYDINGKCKFLGSPKWKEYKNSDTTRYDVYWSENSKDKEHSVKEKNISKIDYKGKVWCFEVPNHIFIVKNKGKIGIHGNSGKVLQLTKEYELIDQALIKGLGVNEALLSGTGPSYSQAALGIEATIKRLKTVQNMMGAWIVEKIYKLEAQMRGFYKKDLMGNTILDYPEIRWADLNLRDETQRNQLYLQLWEKQLISGQLLLEKLNIDYNTEVERVRMEQMFAMQLGMAPGGGQSKGGLGGGFSGGGGGLGGSSGGGKPGAPKGNLPGGQSGPGLPGDGIAPSMSGGGGAPGGAPSGGAPMAAYETQMQLYNQAKEFAPAITRKSRIHEPKKPRVQEETVHEQKEIKAPRTGMFNLTDIERILYAEVDQAQRRGDIPIDFLWQRNPVPIDPECSQIVADGMFPDIKLIVEADGKQWHSSATDIERDRNRDMRLQKHGWTILRFTEDEIKYYTKKVMSKIVTTINDMLNESSNGNTKVAYPQGGYAYRFAKTEEPVPMNERESSKLEEMFQKTASTIESEVNIYSLKKDAEVISEDLSERNKENEEEFQKILEEKGEIEDLIR